jgi:hypothetical protein
MGYYPAGIIITDTNAHTGRFGKIHCLSNATVSLVSDNLTENGSSTISAIEMKSSSEIEGIITSITLASGTVIAYRV